MDSTQVTEKRCSKCGDVKPLRSFYRETANKDGRGRWCKDCCREENRLASRDWRVSHREQFLATRRARYRANREAIRLIDNKRTKEQKSEDPAFRALCLCRKRLWEAVKSVGAKKSDRAAALIGCSPEQLREHLEGKFLPGMTWKNCGINGWEIDHIQPCVSFNFLDPAHQRLCFHYTNLQPLWKADNRKKGARVLNAK